MAKPNPVAKLSPEQWDDWWKGSQMTSLPGLGENPYDAEIREFWSEQLAPRTARDVGQVLDLACGNGGLTWLLNDLLNARSAQAKITGVDFANINPFKRLKKKKARYPHINFIGDTPIESLPFDDASFDIAVSQWGIEYSDLERTIPEVCRVLNSAGRIVLVCHHRESAIVKSSQTTLRGYHALLGDGAIFECLLQLDERYNALGALAAVQADRECGALSARLNRIMYDTKQALQASRSPFNGQKYLAEVMAAFTPGVNMCNPRRRAMIERARDDLLQSIARYDDLWESALTEERLEAMVAALLAGGFGQPQTHPIHYRDTGDVGLAIVASRG